MVVFLLSGCSNKFYYSILIRDENNVVVKKFNVPPNEEPTELLEDDLLTIYWKEESHSVRLQEGWKVEKIKKYNYFTRKAF